LIIKLRTHKIDITYTTMSRLLSLGAINKLTRKYVSAKNANKKDKHECPDCGDDLILCQGKIKSPYYRHEADRINPCYYYSKPSESQIHKDAKMLLKTLLENKTNIQFIRQCVSCKITDEINLPEITECSIITLEHRFNYKDQLRIADVAHTFNGEIKGIYEICNKHKTCSEDRPEPWVEIDANSLLTLANTNNEPLIINCIRCEKCEKCIVRQKIKEERSECCYCRGSGSYWSDDCLYTCYECCCINCEKFEDECECKYCGKCEDSYIAGEAIYLCEKCGKFMKNF
jgi:hypothetical protein